MWTFAPSLYSGVRDFCLLTDVHVPTAVSRAVGIPVVASGGAGKPEHLADAIQYGAADAVLAAGIFHFGACTISDVKNLLAIRGIPVRPVIPEEEKERLEKA